MPRMTFALTALATLMAAAPLAAQGRGNDADARRVPPGHLPPAGLCRVWYEGVPPGRQPAPMSCERAERLAGRNAHVIYGPRTERRDDRRDDRNDRRDDRRDDRDDRRDGGWYDGRFERRDDRRDDERHRVGGEQRSRVDGGRGGYGYPDCVDRNRDGRCDGVVYGGGQNGSGRISLPYMSTVDALRAGRLSSDQQRWLGARDLRPQVVDQNRDGRPEVVLWRDSRGRDVQRWTDRDRDGRADVVAYFDGNGRVIREVR